MTYFIHAVLVKGPVTLLIGWCQLMEIASLLREQDSEKEQEKRRQERRIEMKQMLE